MRGHEDPRDGPEPDLFERDPEQPDFDDDEAIGLHAGVFGFNLGTGEEMGIGDHEGADDGEEKDVACGAGYGHRNNAQASENIESDAINDDEQSEKLDEQFAKQHDNNLQQNKFLQSIENLEEHAEEVHKDEPTNVRRRWRKHVRLDELRKELERARVSAFTSAIMQRSQEDENEEEDEKQT